jgi:hypothetical protein
VPPEYPIFGRVRNVVRKGNIVNVNQDTFPDARKDFKEEKRYIAVDG